MDALVNIEVDVLAKMVEISAKTVVDALHKELHEVKTEIAILRKELQELKNGQSLD